jgi:SRSO17 transposase
MDMPAVLTAPLLDLTPQDLEHILDELDAYHAIFSPLFARREQRVWAHHYLHGLLLELPRKSVEPMVLHLRGADPNAVRTLQLFVSASAWDDHAILQRLWGELASDLGQTEDGVLILDGSDFPKQGQESVGVQRQYCGQLGKIANCQAGVFLAYASERGYALLDRRLYLPEAWFSPDYAARRLACGVPAEVPFRTKPQLGLEMLQEVVADGTLPCQWVCGDEAFGDNTALLDAIDALQKWYFCEVAHDTRVWREREATVVRPWSGRGRRPTTLQLVSEAPAALEVAALAASMPAHAWQRATIQEGSQGPQVAAFAFARVVALRDGLPGPTVWLVLRRALSDGELKCYLSNAPADIARSRLIRVSGMRWPIETCFEVGKQELGMGDYEVRSWRGWHHHMTLVLLALGFLVRLQGRFEQTLRH